MLLLFINFKCEKNVSIRLISDFDVEVGEVLYIFGILTLVGIIKRPSYLTIWAKGGHLKSSVYKKWVQVVRCHLRICVSTLEVNFSWN